MEPAPKRRRKGRSPQDDAKDGDDDDDELSFQPQEVLAKRDPGYKLSLERAYADNRFQATMAHIFAKYGRDFDGIGDEIDMLTGEIVVDNGHLQNMRNEGDVGVPPAGDEAQSEDEGILLDHLTDDDGNLSTCPEQQDDGAGEEDDDDDEDRIMNGREPRTQPKSLVPVAGPQASSETSRPPGFLSAFYGAGILGYGPPSAFGASPFASGASPFAMEPWTLPIDIPAPSWDSLHIFPRSPGLLPSVGGRYDFPVQDGGSSIWAPNYRFTDDTRDKAVAPAILGPARPLPRTRTKPMKCISSSAVPQARGEQDMDEDAILTGKTSRYHPAAKVGETRVSNDDDDPLISGLTPSRKPARKGARQAGPLSSIETTIPRETSGIAKAPPKGIKRTCASKRGPKGEQCVRVESSEAASDVQAASKQQSPEDNQPVLAQGDPEHANEPPHDSLRRRSGRARKQVEFLGKISWSEARQRQPQQRMIIQLAPVDPPRRDDYETVDDIAHEVADAADEGLDASAPLQQADTKVLEPTRMDRIVPDSQDSSMPQSSGDIGAKAKASGRQVGKPPDATHSAYLLSDDEMPVLARCKATKGTKSREKAVRQEASPGPPDSGIGDSVTTLSWTEDDAQQQSMKPDAASSCLQAASGSPRGHGRPPQTDGGADHIRAEQQAIEQRPSSATRTSAAGTWTASAEDTASARRLKREPRWLKMRSGPSLGCTPSTSADQGPAKPSRPRHRLTSEKPAAVLQHEAKGDRGAQQDDALPEIANEANNPASPLPKRPPSASLPTTRPRKTPPRPTKPQTPRHASVATKAPSSRRSLLSLVRRRRRGRARPPQPCRLAARALSQFRREPQDMEVERTHDRGVSHARQEAAYRRVKSGQHHQDPWRDVAHVWRARV